VTAAEFETQCGKVAGWKKDIEELLLEAKVLVRQAWARDEEEMRLREAAKPKGSSGKKTAINKDKKEKQKKSESPSDSD
ncbi:unnamed protein product, partial [Prorocentrum cordatum]